MFPVVDFNFMDVTGVMFLTAALQNEPAGAAALEKLISMYIGNQAADDDG